MGKFRYQDYSDDDYGSAGGYIKTKKRKSQNAEFKQLRLQQYEEDSYGYEDRRSKKSSKLRVAKIQHTD